MLTEGAPKTMCEVHLDAETVEQIKSSVVCQRALAVLTNDWQPYSHLKTLCPFYLHPFTLFDSLRQAGLAEGQIIPLFRHSFPSGCRFNFRLKTT